MIRDLTIEHLSPTSYTLLIGGNGGEEEAVISISSGQDGRTRIIFTAMQVDGGAILRCATSQPTSETIPFLRRLLIEWASGGIRPSAEELKKVIKEIDAILKKAAKLWMIDIV